MKKMTLIATGDAFITRRFPEGGYEGFEQVRDVISQYDVKFSNLEMTFHNEEGYPAAFSGGTWAMADPRTLDDMRSFGFNLFNTANNHSCDYSHGGVLATIRNLKERDMIFAGTGKNLSEASKPCYLETKNGRVAMIAVSSSFHESGMAGGQSAELIGRPGLNPLRHETIYHVTEENYKKAEELAALTKINATMERSVKNGYKNPPASGTLPFGTYKFVLDEKDWIESVPFPADMERVEKEIIEAKKQADIVIYAGSLVNPGLLKETKQGAVIYDSAKMTLEQVMEVIEQAWKEQKEVVRLHTGDPCIYGAIREQMDAMDKFGIKYDICPGVSSFCGTAAALQMEYTLPGISQSVIITRMAGRTPVPEKEEIASFAAHQATMVIFLSTGMAEKLSKRLIAGGYSENTPAAIVYKATWEDEKAVICTVGTLAKAAEENNITKTALMIIGDAVTHSHYERSELYNPAFTTEFRQATKER